MILNQNVSFGGQSLDLCHVSESSLFIEGFATLSAGATQRLAWAGLSKYLVDLCS